MMNDSENNYNEINRALGDFMNDLIDDVAFRISKILMTETKEEKIAFIERLPQDSHYNLYRIFKVAYENEHYEVCQVLKDKIQCSPGQ